MKKSSQIAFVIMIILRVIVSAAENDLSGLLVKLDQIPAEKQKSMLNKYSTDDREFREHYVLTANIRLFGLRIGRMELGEVTISNQDSFSITYDPPFEKWDTRYLSYWQSDSGFVDEVIAHESEKYIYQKTDTHWTLRDYIAENPRSDKTVIYQKGLQTDALNLIEFTRLLYQKRFAEISDVLFLAEVYPIQLEPSAIPPNTYHIYDLKWHVAEGEERIRLKGVHVAGLETNTRYIPLAGILKVSFVGLLDLDLEGIIQIK